MVEYCKVSDFWTTVYNSKLKPKLLSFERLNRNIFFLKIWNFQDYLVKLCSFIVEVILALN